MDAVSLSDVALTFAEGRGVRGVTATVQRGQTVALLGASGSGKSTLLGLMAGTLVPQRGAVVTLGEEPRALSGRGDRALRARVGLLFQADNLTPGLRVVHNVLMGNLGRWSAPRALASLVWTRRADEEAARTALDRVELGDRLLAWPEELSGGEQQRVALARLAMQRPELWLADEPTAGLDVRLRRAMLDMLIALVREQNATLVVALHDLDLIEADFDALWGLEGGRLRFCGAPESIDRAEINSLYAIDG
ncbi:MAG: ATP-binding cassette domain-containing protein [Myxococcota bacterium]